MKVEDGRRFRRRGGDDSTKNLVFCQNLKGRERDRTPCKIKTRGGGTMTYGINWPETWEGEGDDMHSTR